MATELSSLKSQKLGVNAPFFGYPYIVDSFYISAISVIRLSLYLPHHLPHCIINIVYSTPPKKTETTSIYLGMFWQDGIQSFCGSLVNISEYVSSVPASPAPENSAGATDKSKLESRFDSKAGRSQGSSIAPGFLGHPLGHYVEFPYIHPP